MNKINYQTETEKIINALEKNGETPPLLLHSCCGPCSSYVISYLADFFEIGVFYYNPNIFPEEEYLKRKSEQMRLINIFNEEGKTIKFIDADYDYGVFLKETPGRENDKEGGPSCGKCYALRLKKTAEFAKTNGYEYFCTTLSVSPYKNSAVLNNLGDKISKETGVKYLYSDFKKKDGYLKSIRLSQKYDLYRQHYCGCSYSKAEADQAKKSGS